MAVRAFTKKQGQYLAFIHAYTTIHGIPPAEADFRAFFRTTAPSIHSMIKRLTETGLISRTLGQPRTIRLSIDPADLPQLAPRR